MTATIELTSARRKLCTALGEKQKDYFAHMKSWFRKRISKEEFDIEARKLITPENGHLHNEFLLAIPCYHCKNVVPRSLPSFKTNFYIEERDTFLQ